MSSQPPQRSIGHCPICETGLVGIRVCEGEAVHHLLALCDECEAMWIEPDTSSQHIYPDCEHARCPTCHADLYASSHWAAPTEIGSAVWVAAIDRDLDYDPDADLHSDPQHGDPIV